MISFYFVFVQVAVIQYAIILKAKPAKTKVCLEKLRDLDVTCTFQATIGGKFAPLTGLSDEGMDTMITTYHTAVTDAASKILGKERHRKKPWVNKDVLDLCDKRREAV